MVVSTAKAQDTIRIQSYRTVELCSDKKRWLLAVSLGTVRFADSLESFDITIGFNKNTLRPTDVLKEGTLSSQMSYGPTMNTVVPGEMRIFGFNVARSVAGDFPLVAVAGDFIGSCNEKAQLTLPFAPDFNAEFKRRYTQTVVDEIQTVVKPLKDSTLGCRFESSIDTIHVGKYSKQYPMVISRSGSGDDGKGTVQISLDSKSTNLTVGTVESANCRIDSVVGGKKQLAVHYSTTNLDVNEPLLFRIEIQRSVADEYIEGKLRVSVSSNDTCTCRTAGKQDSIMIYVEKPVVSVNPSNDDGSCTISVVDDMIIGKCHHHGMKELELCNVVGDTVRVISEHESRFMELSMAGISHGIYFARMKCDYLETQKTIVK